MSKWVWQPFPKAVLDILQWMLVCNNFLSKYNFKKEVLKPRGYWDNGKIAPRPWRLWTITGCGKMTQLATSWPVGTRGHEYFCWFVMNLNLTGLGVSEWLSPAKCCKTSLLSLCFMVHLTNRLETHLWWRRVKNQFSFILFSVCKLGICRIYFQLCKLGLL